MPRPVVGVLALQGCVEPQLRQLAAAGAEPRALRCARDLAGLAGIVLPGGESTAMLRLLEHADLFAPLREACAHLPVWGVCAGAILLAREVHAPRQRSLALLDVAIERNAYGRQLDSFCAEVEGRLVAFIRAPRIRSCGGAVVVRARLGDDPIWLEQGRIWATTFHPELGAAPSPWHERFVAALG